VDPGAAAVFGAAADAGLGGGGITQQEIGEGIAVGESGRAGGVTRREAEGTARVGGIARVEYNITSPSLLLLFTDRLKLLLLGLGITRASRAFIGSSVSAPVISPFDISCDTVT
jgi:hypothetical protein